MYRLYTYNALDCFYMVIFSFYDGVYTTTIIYYGYVNKMT